MRISINLKTKQLRKTNTIKPKGLKKRFYAEHIAWPTIEEYVQKDDRVIVPVGSQEQHGRHMPVGTDWMIPYSLSQLLSDQTGVFCSSPLCYGMSWIHSAFAGTVCLKPETLISLYRELIGELYNHGFRKILILNGHGGNLNALNCAMSETVRLMHDIRIKIHQWWMIPTVQDICLRRFKALDSHAGPAETSVMLYLMPQSVNVHQMKDNKAEFLPFFPNPDQIRAIYPDGVMQNDASLASVDIGKKIVEACTDYLTGELLDWETSKK